QKLASSYGIAAASWAMAKGTHAAAPLPPSPAMTTSSRQRNVAVARTVRRTCQATSAPNVNDESCAMVSHWERMGGAFGKPSVSGERGALEPEAGVLFSSFSAA